MGEEELDDYESTLELALVQEYKAVVGTFNYAVETDRRFYLANDVALEDLDALAHAFDDADVDLYGVTGAERGNVIAKGVAVDEVSRIHGSGPFRITEALEV